MLFLLAAPAFAEDPQTTAKDLKGISAKRHRFIFTTLGGAAVGAGIGVLIGGGLGWTLCGCDDGLVAGTLIGGGASAWWQAAHAGRTRTANTSTGP
jgi:hypothetical protein